MSDVFLISQDRNSTKTGAERCLTVSVMREELNKDGALVTGVLACTTYTTRMRLLYFIRETQLEVKEEFIFSQSSLCSGLIQILGN